MPVNPTGVTCYLLSVSEGWPVTVRPGGFWV